ncbi:Protein phosphatase 2C family protein [Perilla frutescens var. hirtella]|uniref:protein-serine/threonine phosphatase n=1 Tax=Perilla frutescens var. hirtella TaxID=608512 RepID=A0AAD4IN72_PERFH|nr:Protein phosphatase 2C family protein [Perilla frutescens var. hirtella]
MSSCTVAISKSPVFSPSSSSASVCSPNSSSPRLIRLQKSSGLIKALSGGGDSAAVLKRKRPPRLDIPVFAVEEKGAAEGSAAAAEDVAEVEGDGYSVCCKRGRREEIEDRFSAVVGIQGDSKQAFFGIFDGHGGAKAAEFAAENLDKNIIDELNRRGGDHGEIQLAVKGGYLTTDSEFLKRDVRGGACCVTALITRGNLVVSNAGDCRAVCSRNGVAEALTSDHRPSREDERERIEMLGGFVECRNGVWRVLGSLAVSRAIGDHYLKQWVTAEPETRVLKLDQEYEFLLLASDGLWDKVSNQEAVDIAHPFCINAEEPQPIAACRKLVDLSVSRGSADDISVMLIQLRRFH